MISEKNLIDFVDLEVWNPDLDAWETWVSELHTLNINRGGYRSRISTAMEPGLSLAIFINAGDPLNDSRLQPNLPVRVTALGEPLFTARIQDLETTYELDKTTGELTTYVNLISADAIAAHNATRRYGAVTDGGIGYETWAQRINRLASSSVMPWEPPEDDTPTVKYSI